MKTIAFFNIKGGVGKTTTAVNTAHELSQRGKKVLLIDLDMQGNSSRFFRCYDKTKPCVSDLLLRRVGADGVVRSTACNNIDVIPANMSLITTDKQIMLDTMSPQQTRLKEALAAVREQYDYCILDCPTYLTLAMINGLVAADEVIIPLDIDEQAFEGLSYVLDTIKEIKPLNPPLLFRGCLVTAYKPRLEFHKAGMEWLRRQLPGKVFQTMIRCTDKVTESIAAGQPIAVYSPRCLAAKGYKEFVTEYLEEEV